MLTDTKFVAVFLANILNEDENLAIIDAKFKENCTIFDQKCSFMHYFDLVSQHPISACQIYPKIVIAETSKMAHFGGKLKRTPRYFQNWHEKGSELVLTNTTEHPLYFRGSLARPYTVPLVKKDC